MSAGGREGRARLAERLNVTGLLRPAAAASRPVSPRARFAAQVASTSSAGAGVVDMAAVTRGGSAADGTGVVGTVN